MTEDHRPLAEIAEDIAGARADIAHESTSAESLTWLRADILSLEAEYGRAAEAREERRAKAGQIARATLDRYADIRAEGLTGYNALSIATAAVLAALEAEAVSA